MRQEHIQAHRTPPVPHSSSLCAPSSRVPKPRFNAPETVRGARGNKESRSDWPESGRFLTGSVSLGSFVLSARVLLAVLASSRPSCGQGKPLCLIFLSQGVPFARRVCVVVARGRLPCARPSRYIYSLGTSARSRRIGNFKRGRMSRDGKPSRAAPHTQTQ